MGKVIALVLLAMGTQVDAQDKLADTLMDRAYSQIGLDADLDSVTHGKVEKKPTPIQIQGGYKDTRQQSGKNLVGNTYANMASLKYEKVDPPSYWGGRGKKTETYKPRGVFTPIAAKPRPQSGKGLVGNTYANMASQKYTKVDPPSYWGGQGGPKKGVLDARGRPVAAPRKTKTRAIPASPVARPFLVRGRPFTLADLSTGTALSNITFFALAMSMISFAVLLFRRGSSASDQEPYVSAP